MKYIIWIFLVIYPGITNAQTKRPTKREVLNKFGFTEHYIYTQNDTIAFYFHKKPNSNPRNLVLYLQGTSPDPLFVIEGEKGEYKLYRWFPGDYKLLDESYSYAVIAKTGIPALHDEKKQNLAKYHQFNSLDNRVFQADTVIKFISKNLLKSNDKIVVYGHSEGAPVAAKLGTVNKQITHLGFWAGNALPDFYDFALFNSKASWSDKISKEEANNNIQNLISSFQEIADNPEDVNAKDKDDYTNKRWWSYAEPPINNLLKIDIPIFVQVAANDESAPIESTYLIPLEFIRLKKGNLTYEVCIECDHGFEIKKADGKTEDKWSEIFQNFIKWTCKNDH